MTHPSLLAIVCVIAKVLLHGNRKHTKTLDITRNICYFDDIYKVYKHFCCCIKACDFFFKCLLCSYCRNALRTLSSDPRSYIKQMREQMTITMNVGKSVDVKS